MEESQLVYVDRRFGEKGKGFLLYAVGPVFFAALFVYLLVLASRVISEEGWGQEVLLILGGSLVSGVFFVADSLAVYEAKRVVQKAEIRRRSVRIKPFIGCAFELPIESIAQCKASRSFGYIPGISVIDNNRANIELSFHGGLSFYLYGSDEADKWIEALSRRRGL